MMLGGSSDFTTKSKGTVTLDASVKVGSMPSGNRFSVGMGSYNAKTTL